MWLLLPVILLILTLLALVGVQRWRPAFKSYWFAATLGVLLAALVTLGLRFSLPQQANFPGWLLSPALSFPFTLILDGFSWPLSVSLLALLLAHLFGSVRRASGVSWPIWMPSLALAAAALLAVQAGDLLALALAIFLLDVLQLALHSAVAADESRSPLLERFALNSMGVVLTLAAWATPASYTSLASVLLALAAAIRLGVASQPALGTRQPMPAFIAMTSAGPLAAGLGLLRYMPPLSGALLHIAVALCLVLALRSALLALAGAPLYRIHQAGACLALAAGLLGTPGAVLGFGLLLLFADSLAQAVGHFGSARRPLVGLGAALLSGLWFSATQGASSLYAAPSSVLAYLALPLHALLLLAVLQRAAEPAQPPNPDEPWTLAVENIGAALPAAMLLLLGLVLPGPYGANTSPWWPGLAVLVALTAVWLGRRALWRSGRRLLPPHLRLPRWQLPPARRVAAVLSAGLAGALRLLSSLLEGEAGLLWALLFVALLISVFSQSGLGS